MSIMDEANMETVAPCIKRSADDVPRHGPTLSALRRLSLFRGLSAPELALLAAGTTPVSFALGAQLYGKGKRSPGLYALLSGRVALRVGEPGAEGKVVAIVSPGGYIGLAATALGAPQAFAAEALVESKLLLISRDALLEFAAADAQFGMRLVMMLSREVCTLTADIEAFALHLGRERVASYLLQIAETDAPVTLPAKKSIIASRLSVTPEYFSRMLHDFISTGAIAVKGSQITVLNRALLRVACSSVAAENGKRLPAV